VTLQVAGSCVTGTTGALTVPRNGSLCIGPGTVVNGAIAASPGSSLYVYGATIKGPVSATSPARVTVCGSAVAGALGVTGSTGLVTVGDLDATTPCAGNTMNAGISLVNNRGGVQFSNNTVRGSLLVSGTSGTLPAPDSGSVDMRDNVTTR
jgi:hypothetical protein